MKREKAIRSRHTGHLELRGTKWMACWMENGKRHAASTGETDRAKAEKWLEDRLRPLRLVDQLNAHKAAVNPTIQRVKDAVTAWDEWLASIPENPVSARRALKRKQQIKDDVTAFVESCRATLATLKNELASIESSAPGLKFSEAWEAYERTPQRKRNVTESTLTLMRRRFAQLTAWMAEKHPEITDLGNVTGAVALEYAEHIMPNLGATTYNLTIAALKQFWNTMQDRIGAGKNPWAKVAKQGNADSERREIRADELEVIFREAKKTVPPLHDLFTVMLYTGLRLGDAACLKWSDVDLERGFVSLVPQKTRRCGEKARVRIPITPPLRAMLESCATSKTRKGLVLPDMAHEYEAGRLGGMITKFFRKCGLATTKRDGGKAHSVLSAHSFRHTFISMAANAGIPLVTVQAVVGHMSAEMTAHYFHANDTDTTRHFKALTSTTDKGASRNALDVSGGEGA